ncbi:MAG: hypothetical protein PGN13_00050 [Patulibacter minatonensis]
MRRPVPTYANVTATLALFIALGGTSWAVTQLPKNSVGSAQVRDGSLTKADLAKGIGDAGKDGARGPRGPQGPAGAPGAAGANGRDGTLPAIEAWKAIPLVNNWANLGNGYEEAGYRKDPFGVVHLRGVIRRVDGAPTGIQIATLPEGYRPARSRTFSVEAGMPAATPARVDVHASGELGWAAGPTGEPDYTSLDGISFDAER